MSFKTKLRTEILPKAVEHYNCGLDINAAVVKTAEEFNLNLDQTDRLVEMMNTARVIAHYEKNAEDRASNCDIADKDVVRRLVYGSREKKASAYGAPHRVQDGEFDLDYAMAYAMPERNMRRTSMEKAAEEETPKSKPKSTDGYSRTQLVDFLSDYEAEFRDQRKFAESRLGMAENLLAETVTKVAEALSKGYEPEGRYALFKAACCKKHAEAFNAVEAAMPKEIVEASEPILKKLARVNVLDTSSVDREIDGLLDIEQGIDTVNRIGKVVEACARREVEAVSAISKEAASPFGGGGGNNSSSSSAGSGGGIRASDPWLGDTVKNIFGGGKSAVKATIPEASPGVKGLYEYLHGASLSPETISDAVFPKKEKGTSIRDYIDNVQRSNIITELYNEDDIIKEADPDVVMEAYKTLVQASPEASLNKEAVRSVLRQLVNSVAVSPFDVKQWADLDTTTLKNRAMAEGRKLA